MTRSEDESGTFHVLVVCRANICRSPTAVLMLSRLLVEKGVAEYVDLSSAGALAVQGQPWCAVAAGLVGSGDDRIRIAESHRSRRLEREMIEKADLVLTAAREQRVAVVKLSPAATVRTFTLKESAVLARAVTDAMAHDDIRGARSSRPEATEVTVAPLTPDMSAMARLRWLTSEMHSARGLVRMPAVERRRSWLGRRHTKQHEWIDIPDPHGLEGTRHRPAEILAAVEAWGAAARLVISHDIRETTD